MKITNSIYANTLFQTEPLKDAGCVTNDDCSPMENCQNRVCVNPCTNGNPCDRTAECRIENHRAIVSTAVDFYTYFVCSSLLSNSYSFIFMTDR